MKHIPRPHFEDLNKPSQTWSIRQRCAKYVCEGEERNTAVPRGELVHIFKAAQYGLYLIKEYLEKSGKGTRKNKIWVREEITDGVRTLKNPPRERNWNPLRWLDLNRKRGTKLRGRMDRKDPLRCEVESLSRAFPMTVRK